MTSHALQIAQMYLFALFVILGSGAVGGWIADKAASSRHRRLRGDRFFAWPVGAGCAPRSRAERLSRRRPLARRGLDCVPGWA